MSVIRNFLSPLGLVRVPSFAETARGHCNELVGYVDSHVGLRVLVPGVDVCEPDRFGISRSLALPALRFRACDFPRLTLVARWMGVSSVGVWPSVGVSPPSSKFSFVGEPCGVGYSYSGLDALNWFSNPSLDFTRASR